MFKSLVEISTGELDSSILLSKLFHYATVHGETFMKVIEKFISDLQKSQPDEYFQVTKDQYDFALEKLFKDDQSNRNQIVNPGKSLQHLYKSINNSNILESAVFQPIIYDRSALNKEKYKDILVMREEKLLERWSTAEIGRMALALYTIQASDTVMLNPQASTSESYTPYSESPLGYSLTATPEHQSEEIHSEDLYPIEKSGSEPEADSDSSPECCGCFSKSKKKQGRNRSKRSIGKLFFENHKRQKRMMGQGSSRGKEHPEQLTITDCGHWLATMWFGVNFMLFILGWMLLSFQYYPMYI